MKKIFVITMYLYIQCLGQKEYIFEGSVLNSFIKFQYGTNELFSLVRDDYCNKQRDSCFYDYSIKIFSRNGGTIVKTIPLMKASRVVIDFSMSHDGESLVVISYRGNIQEFKKGPFLLQKYLINEDRWAWEKEFYDNSQCLRLTFSKDDEKIVCVTAKNSLLIDAETGSLLKKSNLISAIIDAEAKYPRYALSDDGRYFAYWKAKYLTFSKDDESGVLFLGDFIWYGIKWLFYFGSIPQQVYIWDIYEDKLYDEILIPYESNKGTPSFTIDEKELLVGPFDGKYKVYSIGEKRITREFFQKESVYSYPNTNSSERNSIGFTDYKTISNDNKFLAACFDDFRIRIVDYTNGNLLKEFEQTTSQTVGSDQYAMSFSPDSKYFAVVTKDNKINLYNTQTWELVWQTEYPQKK